MEGVEGEGVLHEGTSTRFWLASLLIRRTTQEEVEAPAVPQLAPLTRDANLALKAVQGNNNQPQGATATRGP